MIFEYWVLIILDLSNCLDEMLLPRGVRVHWKRFVLAFVVIYALTMPFWLGSVFRRREALEDSNYARHKESVFSLIYKGQTLYINAILTAPGMPSLKERMTTPIIKSTKYIISQSAFKDENLGGCLDWNCQITNDESKANAFINVIPANNTSNGYILFSSQESPVNFGSLSTNTSIYNMSIGFRHDSPVSSPYGYTVLLAKKRPLNEVVDVDLINGKKKGALWLVSHCTTNSKRENLINKLKEYMEVDIYGSCGNKQCPKGGKCEHKINTHYHYYLAVENSICQDYITEKLWNQGYGNTAIPIVLKRKLVEAYVPPNSFIAFDDYKNMEEMGKHLRQLMNNKTEYMKYFEWRQDYAVIYLDGLKHDHLERAWGLCQLCRLLHQNPLHQYRIEDVDKYWLGSCEKDGSLAKTLLG